LRVLLVTALAITVMYLASTWGVAAWHRGQSIPDSGVVTLPIAVDNAPPSVATTDEYGPLGRVSMAYAGTEVEDGLLGEVARPWIAISAYTGDYRALSAPKLPPASPGAVTMTESGDQLAWATGSGIVVYDPVTDAARLFDLEGATGVGSFSRDGGMLTVHARGLRVLELDSGDVVAEVTGTPAELVRRAAWRPDGSAVDFVDRGQLVTVHIADGRRSVDPARFGPDADLAWSPTGDQLVGLQKVDGIRRLFSASVDRSGRLEEPLLLNTDGISLERLIGFSSENTVSMSAYLLESGAVERVLDIRLDGGPPIDLVTLPPSGENWLGSQTMTVAADALRSGSTDFGNHLWPWSRTARLATCVLIGLFGLGLWLTRPLRAAGRGRGARR
jgi:hypothetical protein